MKVNRWDEKQFLTTKYVPKNTAAPTECALTNFLEWKKSRNDVFSTDVDKLVPGDLLQSTDPDELCTRKKDSSSYPSKTIYLLLAGLLQSMCSLNPQCPNFLDSEINQFSPLHIVLDNLFINLFIYLMLLIVDVANAIKIL